MSLLTQAFEQGAIRTGAAVLQPSSGDYTFSVRVSIIDPAFAGPGEFQTIYVLLDDPGTYAQFAWVGLNEAGEIYLSTPGGDSVGVAVGTQNYHVAYVREGTSHRLYLNGLLIGDVTYDASADVYVAEWLGDDSFDADWGPMRFAYARNWSAALTPVQILAEGSSVTPVSTIVGSPSGGLWSDTPLAADLLDVSGNGYHWTAIGDLWFASQPSLDGSTLRIYSDHDMACPGSWYGGFKEARIIQAGAGERALSDVRTGDVRSSTFNLTLSDYDRTFRSRLAANGLGTASVPVRMTTRANRAVLGIPYTVFNGPIVDAQPVPPMAFDITLGDRVSQALLSDLAPHPWRVIGDGFLNLLSAVSEQLDRGTPESIIYGERRRIPGVDPASPQGFMVVPTYLGIETLGGDDWHVGLICGHALADVTEAYVINYIEPANPNVVSILVDEGTRWLIPHHAGYLSQFGAPYQDRRSETFGNDRRYSLIYGKVGESSPDAWADGTLVLALSVLGVETVGDGTGECITDRLLQYKHWAINFLAHQGRDSYQSGAWLTNASWIVSDAAVPIILEASFDACSAIGILRLPEFPGSPVIPAGYIGSAFIGAGSGDRKSLRDWIADWNRSCDTRSGFTHLGQFIVTMLHPTEAIKAAAPLYTDALEVLEGSFGTDVRWGEQVNRQPFEGDFDQATGEWKTTGVADADASIAHYGRSIMGESRTLPFAPGITACYHLAALSVNREQHPPRYITLEATIGHDPNGDSLGYLDLGDYLRIRHFASVSASASEIRLAQVVRHQVQAGTRRVLVECLDCEDLIGYDDPPVDFPGIPGSPSETQTCADALVVPDPIDPGGYVIELNVSSHGTDPDIGAPDLPGPAYHVAWFKYTPTINTVLANISTQGSDYDTVLAVWIGSCGGLTLAYLNDNDETIGVTTSQLNGLTLAYLVPYYISVSGYAPTDGGNLKFSMSAEEIV